MNSTYSIVEAQSQLSKLIKWAQHSAPIAITKHQKTVAYLISQERLQAIVETLEILANPKAMKALRTAKAGKAKYKVLNLNDENFGI